MVENCSNSLEDCQARLTTRLFSPDLVATFHDRPNRFLIRARSATGLLAAHCPDPGRLTELLIPGRQVVLERRQQPGRKTGHTLVAVRYGDQIVPLDASRSNRVVQELVLPARYPGWTVRREVAAGGARLDFLLLDTGSGARHFIEVKTCSLVEHGVAMFPDAPTARGVRHLATLARRANAQATGEVLFLITHGDPERFIPNFHTDPLFAGNLAALADRIRVSAICIQADDRGVVRVVNPQVRIDLESARRHNGDRGSYLLITRLARATVIPGLPASVPSPMPAGYFVYVGSAIAGLKARIARHQQQRKRLHWHIDCLLAYSSRPVALPVRSAVRLECRLAADVARLGHEIIGFGSSDCRCPSHLIHLQTDPAGRPDFIDLVTRYRHNICFMEEHG